LPSPSTYKVISPVSVLSEEATIDLLIDSTRMCWDTDKLEQVFLPKDVEIIKQIPLSTRQLRDRLIWTGREKGIFTVKSAYHLLLHDRKGLLESTSQGLNASANLWSVIWCAQV
jgi:hypothetical protein